MWISQTIAYNSGHLGFSYIFLVFTQFLKNVKQMNKGCSGLNIYTDLCDNQNFIKRFSANFF